MNGTGEWWSNVFIPLAAIEDPRTKPGHLSVLCAVLTLVEPKWWELEDPFLDFGCPGRGIGISQYRLRQLAGLSDPVSLLRYERDLDEWGYIHRGHRPGQLTLYDVPLWTDSDFEFDHRVAIPRLLAGDTALKPGHRAAYLALSFVAEQVRQGEWPRDELGRFTLTHTVPNEPLGQSYT